MANNDRDLRLAPMAFWGPLGMFQEMEKMLSDFRVGFDEAPLVSSGPRLPAVDIRDEGDKYMVVAELPGLKKEDVTIEVGEDILQIKAEKETNVEEKGKSFVRQERGRSSFYRQIALPADVDHAHAAAKMEDGLLKVTLPKRIETTPAKKRLDIA